MRYETITSQIQFYAVSRRVSFHCVFVGLFIRSNRGRDRKCISHVRPKNAIAYYQSDVMNTAGVYTTQRWRADQCCSPEYSAKSNTHIHISLHYNARIMSGCLNGQTATQNIGPYHVMFCGWGGGSSVSGRQSNENKSLHSELPLFKIVVLYEQSNGDANDDVFVLRKRAGNVVFFIQRVTISIITFVWFGWFGSRWNIDGLLRESWQRFWHSY